jgi:hypothetical protein
VVFTHLIGDREKAWHQRLRFAEAKGRGQRFPLSSVNVPIGPRHASIKQNRGELTNGGRFDPQVSGVENMGDSFGVGDPQTILLSRASPVRTPIGEERMFGCSRIDVPREALSNVRYCRTWSGNRSRPLLLQPSTTTADGLQHPTFHPRIESKTTDRGLEWSVPWMNEELSGPGTSSSEILVYLRYVAYVAAAAPLKATHWV